MINTVTLLGRVGKDPDVHTFQDGNMIANLSLATTEKWKDKNTGEKKEATEWHNLVISGPLAAVAKQYITKGQLLYIEGSIKTRSYEKNGVPTYRTEIRVKNMTMLGGKTEGAPAPTEPPRERLSTGEAPAYNSHSDDLDEDGLPF